jgi:hypothetical protein
MLNTLGSDAQSTTGLTCIVTPRLHPWTRSDGEFFHPFGTNAWQGHTLGKVAITHAVVVVGVSSHLHHVAAGSVIARAPLLAIGRGVVSADPGAAQAPGSIVNKVGDHAGGGLLTLHQALVVVAEPGAVEVNSFHFESKRPQAIASLASSTPTHG